MEAELFGHERGAFTDAKESKLGLFEAAEGGFLFLDEVGDIELSLQGKLLKAVEDRTVRRVGGIRDRRIDVRILAASNRDLEKDAQGERFRRDLYFRLAVIILRLPPLRERGEDILFLAEHFLRRFNAKYGKAAHGFDPRARERCSAASICRWRSRPQPSRRPRPMAGGPRRVSRPRGRTSSPGNGRSSSGRSANRMAIRRGRPSDWASAGTPFAIG
jgi:transcriptional regulator with GAF, ATPase, and Fis domain